MIEQENIPYTADEIKAMVNTIEELRKKYNKALERARSLNDEKDVDIEAGTTICEYIFPELKEDNNEEKIRKEIVDFITSSNKYGTNERCEAWLNWLEKQSEKDPCIGCTNDKGCITCENGNLKEIKIEPKFREGDWIANGGANPCYVKSIFGDYYELCSCEGFEYTKPIIDVNYTYHLWTIQDAKDGDVLVSGDIIFIFNNIHGVWVRCHCSLRKDGSFKDRNYDLMYAKDSKEVYPATKEQRDLLFEKMKEAGWEWDVKKKELSKQPLKSTPKFCIGQLITDDNGTWYKIKNIKCLEYYELYDACEDTTHLELCSIIDEKFRENRFVGEIKKMMGD